jgi:hypothetical protein
LILIDHVVLELFCLFDILRVNPGSSPNLRTSRKRGPSIFTHSMFFDFLYYIFYYNSDSLSKRMIVNKIH